VVLVDFLRANTDIFAWSPSDMPGILREVAEHSLDILPHSRAVQQRLRRFDEERRRAIGAELRKLLEAGFIKEVFHPTWLANPVLVKKKNGKWRMCIDYTSLNKACPKVPFPLPRIDQIVDSTAGCELLCFLDAYSGYHQIKMKESDQLVTSFITPFRMFCYVTMPFGIRNAGATYQRCMQHVFGDHIGRTVEAYVDDIVVKTRKADDLVGDLNIVFSCLRANGVKLNPEKCVFGVPRGMLLGYIVSQQGIEANPEKVAALERMGPIRDLKGVQKVLGCLAALSRFISRLGEKGLPLYRFLKKHERFSWTAEAQDALDKLKASLTHALILTPPQDGEPLHGRNHPGGQRRNRGRAHGGRARPASPAAGVLHQRSLVRHQDALPSSPKAAVRGGPCVAQTSPLLRGPPCHGGLLLPAGGDHLQSGRGGQDRQVVEDHVWFEDRWMIASLCDE
jgi:hypothetical protein